MSAACVTTPPAKCDRVWHHNLRLQRMVCWIPVIESLPDDDLTVILAVDGEPWTGFRDGEGWRYVSGDPCEGNVTHWCEFPEVPA